MGKNLYSFKFDLQILHNPKQEFSKLFCEYQQIDYKVYIKGKIPQIVNTILKKTNKVGGQMLLDLKIYYKATVINIPWFNGEQIVISIHRTWKFGHPY